MSVKTNEVPIVDWRSCFGRTWSGMLHDDAKKHPAKFSATLIHRIYQYLVTETGAVSDGDWVLDPFAGVALGALYAQWFGLHWVGVELEEKWVMGGFKNILQWKEAFGLMTRWGTAQVVHGDSRSLRRTLNGSSFTNLPTQYDAIVTSPPFGVGETRDRTPFAGGDVGDFMTRAYTQDRQGDTSGNMAHQKPDSAGYWADTWKIAAEMLAVLRPGGTAVLVTKNHVRRGKIVAFSQSWMNVLIGAGFEPVARIRAWTHEYHGTQIDMFGNEVVHEKERKSFFRRVQESKGAPRIDHEDVLVVRKPDA